MPTGRCFPRNTLLRKDTEGLLDSDHDHHTVTVVGLTDLGHPEPSTPRTCVDTD
jgi:hypothetical protein